MSCWISAPDDVLTKGTIHSKSQLRIAINELTARQYSRGQVNTIVTCCGSGYRYLSVMMMLRARAALPTARAMIAQAQNRGEPRASLSKGSASSTDL